MATILIADNDARVQYTQAINGIDNDPSPAATELTIDFPFFALTDINVIKTTVAGISTTLTKGTGTGTFTVTGTAVDDGFSGGNVTIHDTDAVATTVYTIFRDIPIERITDFPTSGPFNITSLNTELDKSFAIKQELETSLSRALVLPVDDTLNSITLPTNASRINKFLAFDSNGDAIASSQGSWQGNWSSGYIYARGDLVKDTSDGGIYIANTAHTSSGSLPISTNADASKWDQLIDLTSVTTSQNAAANSATAAAGSATAAAASALSAAFADDWAVKTDGVINDGTTTDYSSKAYAIGGTGVTDSSGKGPAKDWAIETTGQVDGTEYSAKEYAIGTQTRGTTGSAKDWATYTGGTVDGSAYSAKYWAEQAAASADNVDDLYLGPKSADPTVDNDGDALTTGDLYFNTSSNVLKVYDGAAWIDAAVDTSSFATKGFSIAVAIAL